MLLALRSPFVPVMQGPMVEGGLSAIQRAIALLRRLGTNANIWLPGVGALNGLQAANYILSDGSTGAAVVDGPVGLVLDANGSVGSELITNGDFSAGSTGWTTIQSGWSVGSGVASVDSSVAGSTLIRQGVTVAGKMYKITFTISSYTSGNIYASAGDNSGPACTAVGTYTQYVVALNTNGLGIFAGSTNTVASVDNISVSEVTGIHASQATTANKPVLRRGAFNTVRNNTMVGATVGVPGTLATYWAITGGVLSTEVTGTSVIDGINYTDVRFYGVPSSTGPVSIVMDALGVSSTVGFVWATSVFVALVAGSFTNVSALTLRVAAEAGGTVFTPTSTLTRYENIRTLAGTGVSPVIRFNCNDTVTPVDFTLRIGMPQQELGAVVSAVVPTAGAAASNPNAGKYSWQFDVVNDSLSLGDALLQLTDDCAVIAAAVCHNPASSPLLIAPAYGGGSGVVALFYVSAAMTLIGKWDTDATAPVYASSGIGSFVQGVPFVGSVCKRGTLGVARHNGVSGAAATIPVGACTVTSAAMGDGSGARLNGSISCAIVIKATLTDTELLLLERLAAALTPNCPSF